MAHLTAFYPTHVLDVVIIASGGFQTIMAFFRSISSMLATMTVTLGIKGVQHFLRRLRKEGTTDLRLQVSNTKYHL